MPSQVDVNDLVLKFLSLTLNRFHAVLVSAVSIVDFEQVNSGWVGNDLLHDILYSCTEETWVVYKLTEKQNITMIIYTNMSKGE